MRLKVNKLKLTRNNIVSTYIAQTTRVYLQDKNNKLVFARAELEQPLQILRRVYSRISNSRV